jgi:hypothetical protein
MALTTVNSGNIVTNFQKKANHEYVREGKFGPFIGSTENALIQSNTDLQKHSIPLVSKLKKTGVSGSTTLSGNEESLSNYAFLATPTYYRHGVLIDNEENEKANIDLFKEARPQLMSWAMELKRDQIIQALGQVQASGTSYAYGTASGANLDTWNSNNTDRILYGAAKSNLTSGDHTTSLGTVDTTSDKLTSGRLTLLKRMAMSANPLIRPIMIKGDEPWFVMFVDSFGFRDLQADATIIANRQYALPRTKDNPLFAGGDIVHDGVIVKEVPDINKFIDGDGSGSAYDGVWGASSTSDSLLTSGNGVTRVGVGFFCGAQAVSFIRGRNAEFKRKKEDDYGFQSGVGIQLKHAINKTFFNSKQHGMITHFYSAAVDS